MTGKTPKPPLRKGSTPERPTGNDSSKLLADVTIRAQRMMLPVSDGIREPGYRFHHGERVALIAERLARQSAEVDHESVNLLVLRCGALVHDMAKGLVDGEHGAQGARLVRERFSDILSGDTLDQVAEIVEFHNKRTLDRDFTVETRLVQDADLIDHLGAMEAWLAVHFAVSKDNTIDQELEWFDQGGGEGWWSYCLNNANFELSRRAIDRRLQYFEGFLKQLDRENRGYLW